MGKIPSQASFQHERGWGTQGSFAERMATFQQHRLSMSSPRGGEWTTAVRVADDGGLSDFRRFAGEEGDRWGGALCRGEGKFVQACSSAGVRGEGTGQRLERAW